MIPDCTKGVTQENVRPHVETGFQIYSDDADYWVWDEYTHEIINQAEAYVRGNIHTSGLENF